MGRLKALRVARQAALVLLTVLPLTGCAAFEPADRACPTAIQRFAGQQPFYVSVGGGVSLFASRAPLSCRPRQDWRTCVFRGGTEVEIRGRRRIASYSIPEGAEAVVDRQGGCHLRALA